jgi:hypothetical protein
MNEMIASDLDMERILIMTDCACIASHFAGFNLASGAMPYKNISLRYQFVIFSMGTNPRPYNSIAFV